MSHDACTTAVPGKTGTGYEVTSQVKESAEGFPHPCAAVARHGHAGKSNVSSFQQPSFHPEILLIILLLYTL